MKGLMLALLLIAPSYAFPMDVHPSKSVVGVPWNSSEKEATRILGEPNGYFLATKYQKLVFYGKSVVLIFVRGKLKGFRYYDTCCLALYQIPVSINSKYNNEPISLNGVVLTGKSFEEINHALPQELGQPDYHSEISTDEVTIKLGFSETTYPGKPKEFVFNSLEIDYAL